jgi:hypothetical protein
MMKTMVAPPDDCFSCSARPVHSYEKPGGRVASASFFHAGDGLTGRDARRRLALQLSRGEQVVANDPRRTGILPQGRDRADRHHGAGGRTGLQVGDVGDVVTRRRLRLRRHPEGAAQEVEVVDVGRAQIDPQRVEHVGRLDPHHQRLVTIDVGGDARRTGVVGREDLLHLIRRLGGGAHHGEGRAFQRAIARAGGVLHHHLEAVAVAQTLNRGRGDDEDLASSMPMVAPVMAPARAAAPSSPSCARRRRPGG